MGAPRYWKPLVRATHLVPPSEELIQNTVAHYKISREEAVAKLDAEGGEYWINPLYQVMVVEHGDVVQLNVRRRDGAPIHDWRHLQQIKNELLGPECEAVELYPAESRLVDTSNKYHLWGFKDPSYRFPIGWRERDVVDKGTTRQSGMRQRDR